MAVAFMSSGIKLTVTAKLVFNSGVKYVGHVQVVEHSITCVLHG